MAFPYASFLSKTRPLHETRHYCKVNYQVESESNKPGYAHNHHANYAQSQQAGYAHNQHANYAQSQQAGYAHNQQANYAHNQHPINYVAL